jgi:seryl-tRNA synthetase
MDSVKRLNGVSTRLHAEAAAGASLIEELAKLAETETNEMRAWADGGCQGPAPKDKAAERQAIATKLAGASATAAAARTAIAETDNQTGKLNNQLRTINAQIEKAALDAMQADFRGLNDQHLAATEVIRKLAAKMHGLCSFLSNEGRRRIDRGEHEAGKAYLARAEALTSIKLASPGVTQGEVMTAANDWSRRAAALRSGS